MKLLIFIAALALGVCSPAHADPAAERTCKAPEGWDTVAEQDPRFVVFGELHGTREGPAFVGQLLCALAQRGEKVLLAAELSSLYDDELQAAWASPIEALPSVLSSWDWQNREDGVASKAMFDLLSLARRLKEDGLKVGVTAFNGAKGEEQSARFAHLPGQGAHEAAQAENIFQAAEAGKFTRVIVLVGGLHARKKAVTVGVFEIELMAKHLERMGSTRTFDSRYASGKRWGCNLRPDFDAKAGKPATREDVTCSSHHTNGWDDDGATPHMALGAFRNEATNAAFDGYFWVGPISASPPAIRVVKSD